MRDMRRYQAGVAYNVLLDVMILFRGCDHDAGQEIVGDGRAVSALGYSRAAQCLTLRSWPEWLRICSLYTWRSLYLNCFDLWTPWTILGEPVAFSDKRRS